MKYGWPTARPFVKLVGHKEIAAKVDNWFTIAEEYHVNEQSTFSLRKALREAGFENPKAWIDPDVLRGGQFHLLDGFEGPVIKLAQRVAALKPVRQFLGNDVIGVGTKS
jgi:hypothetical protein